MANHLDEEAERLQPAGADYLYDLCGFYEDASDTLRDLANELEGLQ